MCSQHPTCDICSRQKLIYLQVSLSVSFVCFKSVCLVFDHRVSKISGLLQAGIINKFCQLMDPEGIRQELIHIKSLNIDGVVVDCWWGIVEGWNPQKYVWSGYRELFNIIREFKLNLQVYISIAHIM